MKYAPRKPGPKRKQIGFRAFEETIEAIDRCAAAKNMTRNAYMEEVLERILNMDDPLRHFKNEGRNPSFL